MKEFEIKAQIVDSGLTKPIGHPTLDVRGNIFMPEPGNGEQPPKQPEPKPTVLSNPFTSDADQIENEQLRKFAIDFQNGIKENPLFSWSTEDLRSEYLRLSALTAKLSSTGEFFQRERASADAAPLSRFIIEQLSQRGVDLEALFLEAVGKAETAGTPLRSVGAATLSTLDFPDPRLQNIVQGLNAEVNRVGAGNPLSQIFIDREINRVQRLIDQGQVDPGEANRLLGELNTWMAETGAGQRRTQRDIYTDLEREIIDHIQNTPNDPVEKQRLVDAIKEEVNKFPAIEANQFSPELLELASYFKETRETLINRILFRAYEDSTETNDYRESMTLYAQSNLDSLLGFLSKADPEKYRYFVSLRTAASLFHDMNVQILGGNLDQFINTSQRISYEHFELMKKISGAPDVMRLYEEKYIEYLSLYGRITTEGYKLLKKDVEKSMRILNEKKQVKSDYTDEREGDGSWKMEEWELQRALNVGRTFFNITFRGAEQIASGQVPRKGSQGEKQYASFPQESAVRIMNWIQWMTYRFQIAEPRGGLKFLQMVKDNYKDFLKLKGRKLGVNRIKEFGGMNTDELEVGAMFGVSGIYSSWRAETMAFPVIKISIGGNEVSIREWMDDNATEIDEARKSGDQDQLYNVLRPLIDNSNLGAGILLKHVLFSEKVGYKSREALWERVSENNLPLMINYLSRIQFENEGELQNRVALLRQDDAINWDEVVRQETLEDGTTLDITKWDVLSEKIFLQHHKNIKRAAGINVDDIEDQGFDADEQRLRNLIIEEGRNLAPHLADIVFPYVPFMNDVPFELLDYAGPGEEFFKRRTGGDLPSFSKAEGAFISIMNNPGGLGHEEVLKQFDVIVKGIEQIQGTGDGQERVFPMFEAWFDWVITKSGQRQAVFKAIKQGLRKSTSIAQDYAGTEADSLDEHQMRKIGDEAVKIGILNVNLYEDLKKKKKLTQVGLLWALLRDFFYLPFVSGAWEFGKKVQSEKG